MAGGVSIHAVDVARGVPAAGMRADVYRLDGDGARTRLGGGALDAKGLLDLSGAGIAWTVGVYEVVLQVGAYYRSRNEALPEPPFLDVVPFRFGVAEPGQHYHLPLKLSPWGFSLFRGA